MGSFMGKTKIYYEFKRKNVNCYSCPAYRATLLHIKGVGEKTPLPFPFYALYLLSRPNAILRSCMGKEWASMGKLMGKKWSEIRAIATKAKKVLSSH